MPKRLTNVGIEALKPTHKRRFIGDTVCSGLFLVVQPSGKKGWTIARRLNGKLVKMFLGGYPNFDVEQARQEAQKYLRTFDRGDDPRELKKTEIANRQAIRSQTVAAVGEDWLKRDQSEKKTFDEVNNYFHKRIIPALGDVPITSLTKRQCMDFVYKIGDESSKVRARRVFSFLHRFLAWTVEQDILPFNPLTGAKKPGQENVRRRVLTDSELVEVWKASDHMDGDPRRKFMPFKTNQFAQNGPLWGPIIKLLILTGARREEIGGLQREEIRTKDGLIWLPGERTKRLPKHKDKERLIYLSQKAKDILAEVEPVEGCKYVFTTTRVSPVSGWGMAKARLDRAIKKARLEAGITEDMPEWRIHDLRRTLATGFQRLGVRLEVTETVLGHITGSRSGVVAVYQTYGFEKESKEAVEVWANHLDEILAGKIEEKIISFTNEKRKVVNT